MRAWPPSDRPGALAAVARSSSELHTCRARPTATATLDATMTGLASVSPSEARKPTTPKAMKPAMRDREGAPADDAQTGPDGDRHSGHEQLEGELVVGPEQGDHEVLGTRRLQVDDDLADGRDQRRRAGQDAGQQLGDADGQARRDATGQRGQDIRSARPGGGGGQGRRGHVGIVASRCDIRMSGRSGSATQARRPATTVAGHVQGQPEGRLEHLVAQHIVDRPGGHDRAPRPGPGRGRSPAGSPRDDG